MLTLEHRPARSRIRSAPSRFNKQAHAAPRAAPPIVQRLPSCACGGSCPRCQAQCALRIGEPDDHYEREADAVADRVMRMADGNVAAITPVPSGVQRKCAACELEDGEPILQRKGDPVSASSQSEVSTAPASVPQALNSPGQPLPSEARAFFEPRFGYDFSGVRVHADGTAHASASAIDAIAYTVGKHIVFANGHYAPDTPSGRWLLAHELTHTIQQGNDAKPRIGRFAAPAINSGAGGLIQRAGCAGKSRGSCFGSCTHPTSGNPGHCMWSGSLKYGCVCYEKPRLSPAKEILYDLVMAALITAAIVVSLAAIAAIIVCLMGPCEVAALVAALGFAGAMIVIGIINAASDETAAGGETAAGEGVSGDTTV